MTSRLKTKLLLANLSLKNFRAYGGNEEISVDFSLDPKKTITIIHGEMGLGKTTMLDAIYWCLYGEERSKKGNAQSGEGIININILEKMTIGEKGETFVEIVLHDQEGIRFKIKREISFQKESDSIERRYEPLIKGTIPAGFSVRESAEFHYLKPMASNSEWEIYTTPDVVNDKIEKIFPKILSSYFLFDAELLNDFFLSEADMLVKNGIEKISGLPLVESARDHLKKTSTEIERQIADSDVSTKPIADEMRDYEVAISEHKDKLDKATNRLDEIKIEKRGYQEFLRQHDDQEIQNLQNQIEELDVELSRIAAQKEDKEELIRNFLLESIPKLLLRETIINSEKMFQHHEDEGRIPPTISKLALDNILSSNPPTCICGTILQEGSKEKKMVVGLRERVVDSALTQQITVGRTLLSNIVNYTDPVKLSDTFRKWSSDRGQLTKLYGERKSKRNTLQQKLDNHNVDEVQKKSKQLHTLEQEEINLIGERKLSNEKILAGERKIQELKQQLEIKTSKSSKYQAEKNKARLAKMISTILEQCRKQLVDELRDTTAKLTTKYFLNLVSKKDDFKGVNILPNYQTVAYGEKELSKSLSAGQSCCLALSYIAAIRDIANRDYFMMIDSPLHNISGEERVEIAQNLPGFIPGTQITLLVQDQEYTGKAKKRITGDEIPSVRDTLRSNHSVWREYLLETEKTGKDAASNTRIIQLNDFSKDD
jgi:DNA sulfur modification protein DndD